MAIDFMVMPLSRYVAGDFVTPAMQFSWDQSLSYRIIGPDGTRELPPNVPFGGTDAAANRERAVPLVLEDLRGIFSSGLPWDERSAAAPRFHRVDPTSFMALLAHEEARTKPSLLTKIFRPRRDRLPHLFGTLFVPGELPEAIEIVSPISAIVASVAIARSSLDRSFPEAAESARETFRAALQDASDLGLPMIVDM